MILNCQYFGFIILYFIEICRLGKSKTRIQSLYDAIVTGYCLRAHNSVSWLSVMSSVGPVSRNRPKAMGLKTFSMGLKHLGRKKTWV